MTKKNTISFEVDFKTRLAQRDAANNAVRLPRLGYALYRVYDIVKTDYKRKLNFTYGSKNNSTSSVFRNRGVSTIQFYKYIIDDLLLTIEKPYKVKWLKPKHVTVLRMKGHRVEPTDTNDKGNLNQGNSGPVRVGI